MIANTPVTDQMDPRRPSPVLPPMLMLLTLLLPSSPLSKLLKEECIRNLDLREIKSYMVDKTTSFFYDWLIPTSIRRNEMNFKFVHQCSTILPMKIPDTIGFICDGSLCFVSRSRLASI